MKLATPRQDGGLSLERCIAQRRSVRSFGDEALTKGELGQLLWVAQGLTGSDGGRAVPSAGALYPLELYAVARNVASLPAGVYRYAADRHELARGVAGSRSEALVAAAHGQDWIAAAPVAFASQPSSNARRSSTESGVAALCTWRRDTPQKTSCCKSSRSISPRRWSEPSMTTRSAGCWALT